MFGHDKETKGPDVTKIQQAVQSASSSVPGVRNLNAINKDGQVEIHGIAESLSAKQNVMRAITDKVGDTAGVVNLIQVAAETRKPVNQTLPGPGAGMTSSSSAAGARTHTVKKGETLTHIAQHYYGKASEFRKIFDANRDKLSDPDKVREGVTLTIP
ncbi:MAG TPA: LysM peptidoglycan-binding domain-containing protein [Thermoanaerobaculia bacterium]|nr:LysM peptidoglycan-binding domain-containing protein [Thermoanaerobaculia bacterium]